MARKQTQNPTCALCTLEIFPKDPKGYAVAIAGGPAHSSCVETNRRRVAQMIADETAAGRHVQIEKFQNRCQLCGTPFLGGALQRTMVEGKMMGPCCAAGVDTFK